MRLNGLISKVGLSLAVAASLSAGDLSGEWRATLEAGPEKLRLVLKVAAAEGRLTATVDSPDQGVTGIAGSLDLVGRQARLELSSIGASYTGTLSESGTEITGEWRQGGASLPLTWSREAGRAAEPGPPEGLPGSLAGFSDESTFALFLNEERLGAMQSSWKADGRFESRASLSLAGQTANVSTIITPDAEGRWQKVVVESALGSYLLEREGSAARSTFQDKTTTFTTRAGLLLFDQHSPALISLALRRYDAGKGGPQTFPVLILGGPTVDVTLEAKETFERTIGGRDLELRRFVYTLAGFDVQVTADQTGRLYLAEVPAQKAAFVREGFESLRKPAETDPLVSRAEHEVEVQPGVGVPMRDGVKLATDIYRPAGIERAPVILLRTPYKKEMLELQGRYYARRGYAFAVQDCRGRFASEGVWRPFLDEAKDGHDAIEWLARQPWSTGKLGMIGGSYAGWVQWWAAGQRPPHLVTIVPNVSPPEPFYNIPYEYGAFYLWGAIWWADVLESKATADLSGAALFKTFDKKYTKLLRALPVVDLDKAVLGKPNPYWRDWIAHPSLDGFWAPALFNEGLREARIPVFHQSGWFDGDGIGAKLNYQTMARYGHPHQKLTLGPWGHTDTATRQLGDRDFGPEAAIDLQRDYLRWFDCWLKGKDNGIQKEPLVSLFVMGSNTWLKREAYPLPQTRSTRLYLTSGGRANTSKGDGRLSFDPPPSDAPADRYVYDPGDPTPDPRMYEESEEDERRVRSEREREAEAEGYWSKVTGSRQDILVYATEPLAEPLTFVGPVSAVLFASTSARDTDWFMGLVEVDKDGKILPLAQGKVRARYRRSMKDPELLEPGKVYEYALDLWHTGIRIPAGHRLRVEVASASFPTWSRNLNTGGHNETETRFLSARQAVHHSARYPSHVLLPVVDGPRSGKSGEETGGR